jgi:hypothetical protein
LEGLARVVIERIFKNSKSLPVALAGGVFCNCALVRQVFCGRLRDEYGEVLLNGTIVDPVKGALEMARSGARS